MPLRILLADTSRAVLDAWKDLVEAEGFDVVGEASNGPEAVELARTDRPDVAVLDLAMPAMGGLATAREIGHACPETRLILLTTDCAEHQIVTALRAGILGYVAKADTVDFLIRAIREISRGRIFLSPGASRVVIRALL